jgi:hypothetical protein
LPKPSVIGGCGNLIQGGIMVRLSRSEKYIIRTILIVALLAYSLIIFAVGYKYGYTIAKGEYEQLMFEQQLDTAEGGQE